MQTLRRRFEQQLAWPAGSLRAAGDADAGQSTAAVLILLFEAPDLKTQTNSIHVLLTRRSDTLRSHGGEVAFPGGKRDPEDEDDIACALRECREEIGLTLQRSDIIGTLPRVLSKHRIVVTPVVAVLTLTREEIFNMVKANPTEVSDVFDVPLSLFLEHEVHRSVEFDWLGEMFTVHFFDVHCPRVNKAFNVFGLTAGLLILLAMGAYERDPDFAIVSSSGPVVINVGARL